MKTQHELATLLLWVIAVIATALVVSPSGLFTYLAPLYAVCMIGSLVVVRRARRSTP